MERETQELLAKDSGEYGFDAALEHANFGNYHIQQLTLAAASLLAIACIDTSDTYTLPQLGKELSVTIAQQSHYVVAYNSGLLVGTGVFTWLSQSIGRRTLLAISFTVAFVAQILMAALGTGPEQWTTILVFRALVGVGNGGAIPLNAILISEKLAPSNRGTMLSAIGIGWFLGDLYLVILAQSMHSLGWRMFNVLVALPCVLVLATLPKVTESPRFLFITQGKDVAQLELESIATINLCPLPAGTSLADTPKEIREEQAELPIASAFRVLLGPSFFRTTLLLWVIWFCIAFVLNLTTFVPLILMSKHAVSQTRVYQLLFLIVLAEPASIATSMSMIDSIGRLAMMWVPMFIATASAFCFAFSNSLALSVLFLGLEGFFLSVAFTGCHAYTSEAYPTVVRSLAYGSCALFDRLAGILCPFVVSGMYTNYGWTATLCLFASALAVASVCISFLPRDKTREHLKDFITEADGEMALN